MAGNHSWTALTDGNWSVASNWDSLPTNDGTADVFVTNGTATARTAQLDADWHVRSLRNLGGGEAFSIGNPGAAVLSIGADGLTGHPARWLYLYPRVRFTGAEVGLKTGNLYFNQAISSLNAGGTLVRVQADNWKYVQFNGEGRSASSVTWSLEGGQIAIYNADPDSALGTNTIRVAGPLSGQRYLGVYGSTASNDVYWTATIEIDEAAIGAGAGGRIPFTLLFQRTSSDADATITHVRGRWTTKGGGPFNNQSGIGAFQLYGRGNDEKARVYYEADNSGLAGNTAPGDNAWSGDVAINAGIHVLNAPHAFGTNNSFTVNLSDQSGGITTIRNRSLLATAGTRVTGNIRVYGGSVFTNTAAGGLSRATATVGLEGPGEAEFSGRLLLGQWPDASPYSRVFDACLTAPPGGLAVFSGVIATSTVAGTDLLPEVFVTGGGTTRLTAANAYVSRTLVQSNSTLWLEGSLASSNVSVESGSTLLGGGVLGGALAIGGRIAPGSGIGTLQVGGDATFAPGAVLEAELSAADSAADRIAVGGRLNIANATLALKGGRVGSVYTVGTGTNRVAGGFAALDAGGLNAGLQVDAGQIAYWPDRIALAARSATHVTLGYAAGAHGAVTGATEQAVTSGGSGAPVTAVPEPGGTFTAWSDGSTANPRADLNVTGNVLVMAYFTPNTNTYTLAYTAGANGSLGGMTNQTVAYGASGSPVTATPSPHYHFVTWSDGSTANPRTDTNVTNSVSVTAIFGVDTFTVTYLTGPNGTIAGVATQVVAYGAHAATVTPAPGTGYKFHQWSDYRNSNPRTDYSVTSDITVTAYFGPLPPAGSATFVTNLLAKPAIPHPAEPFVQIFAEPETDAYAYGFQTHGDMTQPLWEAVFNHVGHLSAYALLQPRWPDTWSSRTWMRNGLQAAETAGRKTGGGIGGLPVGTNEENRVRILYSDPRGQAMSYWFQDSEEEMIDQVAGGGGVGRLRGATWAANTTGDASMYTAASADFDCTTSGRLRAFTVAFGLFTGNDMYGNWPNTKLAASGDTANGWRIEFTSTGWQGSNTVRFVTYRNSAAEAVESPAWPYADAPYWRTVTVTAAANAGDPQKLDAEVKVECAAVGAVYTRTGTVHRPNTTAPSLYLLTARAQSAAYQMRDMDDFLLKDHAGATVVSYDFEPAAPGGITATLPIGTLPDRSGLGHDLFTPAGWEANYTRRPTHGLSPELKDSMGRWMVDELLAARAAAGKPAPELINNWRISETPGRLAAWRTEGFTHGGTEAYWLNPALGPSENAIIWLARRGSNPTRFAWDDGSDWSQLWLGVEYRSNAPPSDIYDDLVTLQVLQGARWFVVFTPMSFGHLGSQAMDMTDPAGMANVNADAIYAMCQAASWFQPTAATLAGSTRTEEKYGDPAIGADTLYIRRDNAVTTEAWFAAIKVAGTGSYSVSLPATRGLVRNLKTGATTAVTDGRFNLPLTQAAEPYYFRAERDRGMLFIIH